MTTYHSAITEIKRLDRIAQEAEKEADTLRWDEAEKIYNLVAGITTGEKQTKIQVSRDAGISRNMVNRFYAVWEQHGHLDPAKRPAFLQVVDWGNTPREKIYEDRIKKDPERAITEGLKHATPAVRKKIAEEVTQDPEREAEMDAKFGPRPHPTALERKEAKAWAADQPIVKFASTLKQSVEVVTCVSDLEDATSHLRTAMDAGQLDEKAIDQIHKAYDMFTTTLREAEFMMEKKS
jgi:hypothetical protein